MGRWRSNFQSTRVERWAPAQIWCRANNLTHLYEGNGWLDGANNQYPTDISDVSSFDAIDAAIAHFTDKNKFPMIEHIVLAGHSAGGQGKHVRSTSVQVPD